VVSDAAAGSLLLWMFICGVLVGIFVIVCWASNSEDGQHSLKKDPPDNASGGVRRLVGVGRRPGERGPCPKRAADRLGDGRRLDR